MTNIGLSLLIGVLFAGGILLWTRRLDNHTKEMDTSLFQSLSKLNDLEATLREKYGHPEINSPS